MRLIGCAVILAVSLLVPLAAGAQQPGAAYRIGSLAYGWTEPNGKKHSPPSATGTAWEHTPWHATQRAAWAAMTKADVAGDVGGNE